MKSFLWQVRIYYEDTDNGGVVYYANYLKYMERARTEWLRALGFEQDQLIAQQNIVFAVRSVNIDYLRPARFNDKIDVVTRLEEIRKASVTFAQTIRLSGSLDSDTDTDALLVKASVKVACLDMQQFKPKPIPEQLVEEFTRA